MCGIAGIVKFDPRERVEEHRLLRMRDGLEPPRPRRRGAHGRRSGGAGAPASGDRGCRRWPSTDVQRGRQRLGGATTARSTTTRSFGRDWRPAVTATGRGATPKPSCTSTRKRERTPWSACTACSRSRSGIDRSRRLLLARDRLGIKPLYYACTDTELIFASEIKAVLAAGSIRPAFNEHVLPEFLATRFVSTEDTFFNGIRKLLPAHVLSWSPAEGIGTRRYWHLPVTASRPAATMQSEVDGLRDRLETAVHSHLMSDVPLGVFLSGGLDSSALAALVARAIKEPVRTFAVGFREREANELEFARLAAKSVGAEHRDVVVTPEQYFDALPDLVWHEDEPIAFPSSVPLYFVSRLAREHVKVVLTGEGADELFLGYNRYRVTLWNARFGQRVLGDCAAAPAPARAGSRRDAARVHRALRASRLRRPRAGLSQSVFRKLRGVSRGASQPAPGVPCLLRRAGPVRRPGALLRGRRREPCSSA